MEEFKKIKDFPDYLISTEGNVFSNLSNKILQPGKDSGGYYTVALQQEGRQITKTVHRLVAEAFLINTDSKPVVNHKDGNKLNNKVNNLEWVTYSENNAHAYALGLKTPVSLKGETNGMSKLTQEQVNYIREVYIPRHKEFSGVALAKKFGVHPSLISSIIKNKHWKINDE